MKAVARRVLSEALVLVKLSAARDNVSARSTADECVEIACIPSFVNVRINDQERTAVRLIVEPIPQAKIKRIT